MPSRELLDDHRREPHMTDSGKFLERLVGEIERLHLPDTYEVIPNLKVYDDEGVLRNEYDLVIRGPVGTTSFSWLIECRDRP